MSLVAGLLRPRLFSSKLSKLKATEKYSRSATTVKRGRLVVLQCSLRRAWSLGIIRKILPHRRITVHEAADREC